MHKLHQRWLTESDGYWVTLNGMPRLTSHLTACPSDKTVIGGVNACGKVWKLGSGDAALMLNGKLVVDLQGHVLNDTSVGQANGTRDGVDAVAVAVICGGAVAAQTEPMALSKTGDAHIEGTLTVPKSIYR